MMRPSPLLPSRTKLRLREKPTTTRSKVISKVMPKLRTRRKKLAKTSKSRPSRMMQSRMETLKRMVTPMRIRMSRSRLSKVKMRSPLRLRQPTRTSKMVTPRCRMMVLLRRTVPIKTEHFHTHSSVVYSH